MPIRTAITMLQRIGEYEVRFEIGRGGFGRVYLGYDPRVGRLVAIKVIDKTADLSLVGRFRTEANAAGNLHHKNIVTIYGYGEDDGQAFLVMEYLEGQDLYKVIDKKVPLSLLEKISIMSQVADGLACAHKNGVIHRDVKPANVMVLADGSVKIMDFGIARLLREDATRLTQGSDLVGTVSYMAPEQFANSDVDALCDVWAFGVIYYELLTGKHPFPDKNPGAIMYRITTTDPRPILSLAGDCPPGLDRIVMRLLSRDRENRYQSFEDVQFEIAPVLRGLQKIRATELVAEATALLKQERLDDANALLGTIMDLDPANEEVRKLRTEIQEQRRQRSLRPRIVALLRQAEIEVAKRNFPAAIRAVDAALRLDPQDTAIQNYQSSLLRAWEGAEAALQLTHQARHQLELADLTGAFQIVTNALRADPGSSDAQRLMEQIREEMKSREEQSRLRDQVNRAEVFLAIGALHEAAAFVNQLGMEYPDSVEVAELAERLSRQITEAALQEHLQAEIKACQNLLRTGELIVAATRLDSLCQEFPQEDQPRHLLAFARQELQARERVRFCEQLEQKVWSHLEKKHFQEAQEIIEGGLRTHPSELRLQELLQAVAGSKSEYEKAQHLEDQLQRCRELRDLGQLDEARGILDVLRGDFGEDSRLIAQRAEIQATIQQRTRARVIQAALERAHTLLGEHQPDSAVQLLHRTIGENGEDERLQQLLAGATAAQQQAEKKRELEWRLERVAEYEGSREWDAALALIKQGIEIHGQVESLSSAGERIDNQQKVQSSIKGVESAISRQEWTDARSMLRLAQSEHPGESVWQDLAGRIAVGEMQAVIERSLAERDLERARDLIAKARQSPHRVTKLDVFESELRSAEFRRASLDQARTLSSNGDYAQADVILGGLLERRPSDSEVISARRLVQDQRQDQERAQRRQSARDEARKLVTEEQFDGAIRVLKRLLKDSGPDAQIEEDLHFATAEKQRVLAEKSYAKGRQEASALVSKGEFEAAVRKYRSLLDQYPNDKELAQEAAEASEAWQTEKRKQAALRERVRALQLVRERKYDAALRLLQPLLQEFRDDQGLQDAWRTAMAQRTSRSDWLDIYEQISQIEELYQRGKAEKVRERSLRLLEYIEEPRVREMLEWAEDELTRQPKETVSFSRPRDADLPAILMGPIAALLYVLWILVARR
jgi:eukaryotic-like serine/threonine-protein kinase